MQFSTLNIETRSGPVSLATSALSDLKAHLKVTSTYEDDLIKVYIDASLSLIETYCGITIGEREYQLNLPYFPVADRYIELPRGPVASVESLYYYDSNNVSTLWESSDYDVSLSETPARLYLQQDDVWEPTYERPDACQLRYTAGVSSWSSVPANYKPSIYYLVAHQYRFRQPVLSGTISTELPWGLRANLQAIREDFQTG